MKPTMLRPSEAAAIARYAQVDTAPFHFRARSQVLAKTHEQGWRAWLAHHFPTTTSAGFAPRHEKLWEWFNALTPGVKPDAQVEIWPRGGGKSTNAELGVTFVGVDNRRRFALYVCATQGQANKHVQAIGADFDRVGSGRATNRYGNSLGWRMDLLRVAGGFSVLALGLDAAGRGVKIEDFRPDLIVFDDIDERHDTEKAVNKKIKTLTEDVLPMGAPDVAVLVIQNRVHADSIVSRLADGRADFLHRRQVHEEPALRGFDPKLHLVADLRPDGTRSYRLTAGTPTWAGQTLATAEAQLNDWGRSSFLREAQHDMTAVEGGLWKRERDIDPFRDNRPMAEVLKDIVKIAVSVDPNAEGGKDNDDAGITVGGLRRDGHGVLLADETVEGGPKQWARAAVDAYHRWQANKLLAEKNNGGQMVTITIQAVERKPEEPAPPKVDLVHASRGKSTRAEPVQMKSEEGRIHHAGVFPALEAELCTWQPGEKSPNRLDSYVHLFTDLLGLKDSKPRLAPWFPGMKVPAPATNGHKNGRPEVAGAR